jgi:hypothetical protein
MPRKRSLHCLECGAQKILTASGAQKCRACANRWNRADYHNNRARRLHYMRRHVRVRYGVKYEQLELLFIKQGGRCAICLRSWQECSRTKRARYDTSFLQHLNVDHDHKTGRVRGLLCRGCNSAIGQFYDDPKRIDAAMDYLRQHQGTAS